MRKRLNNVRATYWTTHSRDHDTDPDPMTRLGSRVVIEGDCWVIPGVPHRYPMVSDARNAQALAHRFVYEQVHNLVLPPYFVVHHICENKRCIRPEHLAVMTNSDHVRLHNNDSVELVEVAVEPAAFH